MVEKHKSVVIFFSWFLKVFTVHLLSLVLVTGLHVVMSASCAKHSAALFFLSDLCFLQFMLVLKFAFIQETLVPLNSYCDSKSIL